MINPPANVLPLKTLMSIIRTGKPIMVEFIEICYNFSISNDLTQRVNFSTWIPDYDYHSPDLLDLFLSSNAGIYSTIVFPPLGNSDHVVV